MTGIKRLLRMDLTSAQFDLYEPRRGTGNDLDL
jgi:hypothetical protein